MKLPDPYILFDENTSDEEMRRLQNLFIPVAYSAMDLFYLIDAWLVYADAAIKAGNATVAEYVLQRRNGLIEILDAAVHDEGERNEDHSISQGD